jgi:lipopolysaccharide/colanic/teichoic acid biosynthesis glycosyltransferase
MVNVSTAPIYRSYGGKPARWNFYFITKRAFDILVCLAILPLLLPVMAAICVLIRVDSLGSAIFLQERIGRRGRRFNIYKFRTMCFDYDDQEDRSFMQAYISGELEQSDIYGAGGLFKPANQKYYTRMGRILRRTSLDEILQIFNVLKGEMSLVGPRPNVPWEVEKYRLWHQSRLDALPGITGLAQVNGRSSITFDEMVRYDIRYVLNYSFALDLKILWLTATKMFSGHGAG